MKENVGTADRICRFVSGPALMALGYNRWGGRDGEMRGLAAIVGGVLLVESAITRVCPISAAVGIDSRSESLKRRDLERPVHRRADEVAETSDWAQDLSAYIEQRL